MKVTVEFLSLPNVAKIVGARSLAFDFDGGTVPALVSALVRRYGEGFGKFVLDESEKLDLAIQVRVNRGEWLRRERFDEPLRDGDVVTFAMLLGGG